MCVAMPGKVLSVSERTALVDFNGNRVNARTGLVKIEPGDNVLVHAGCILQKVSDREMEEMNKIMEEMDQLL
ncbi:MAG: HypC/HybG/HupF family hydrogenase formation chaperone [Lachnospiraceae bacterium]|nr:HypC/HybG/HupF family hydrogenase formation chaperone [Lachnospiraceae bacterium]